MMKAEAASEEATTKKAEKEKAEKEKADKEKAEKEEKEAAEEAAANEAAEEAAADLELTKKKDQVRCPRLSHSRAMRSIPAASMISLYNMAAAPGRRRSCHPLDPTAAWFPRNRSCRHIALLPARPVCTPTLHATACDVLRVGDCLCTSPRCSRVVRWRRW